ncbi:MAG: 30S ribosomal protein S1 [Candidatus Omnitrophica bacterium CG12_big_fil_rev_8_21_14_0_65_43_15]|uniref:Small ribosomal subunit protein bS1 n=1 Tax=Candidatus Taenaricola geysiri TaxID=1974752 RepID=A0A2J0LLN3_9BACT|nr:MAG: 30S ribosomal protein S1 [Candidatus Omnitrophica bacterium CG10_big_fil_rev_8_21_14_0_10_43_8]PIW66513.1 MAG: 30S ribosomal protein S1 [Candidatus Omnitrophica bacterium CG12_big_fil_rev_8_21_14_0_65_43_15]PIW79975.1 MAG: 30S ribosomal protein S1 [Candidatus Omnitrophica bacterium CG_4_8_14_3_um_filter_43_15]PIY83912.1 MAG: 30S ribosomal protein S1 [Candidatus Omnitrophica bacterium CG_4_10_14_0_8_um_filter_43_18]PJC46741.1 MAG: 30S ribosomal protein S1 [Candidatus Omnitrophica bacteri
MSEEFKKLFEESMRDFREGQIVKGKILNIRPNDIVVDIGYKSEATVPASQFKDISEIKVGDEIDLFLERLEDETGSVVVSKERADKLQGWDFIVNNCKEGSMVKGKVLRKTKGGLVVDIGVEAFLPASLITVKGFPNLNQMLGQTLNFKIVKINDQRKNIVVSRKDVLAQEREETKNTFFQELQTGQIRQGVVKNITDFGAFVSLGNMDGLLHITDMSWGRISHPSEMLAVGDKIDIVVLGFDKDANKISLGLKQNTPNPWEGVEAKYPVGSRVKGKVTNIVPYGAFVELEKGVEGLVHISELSWTKRVTNINEILAIGDVVEVVVLNIDKNSQRISLGVKQTETNPWLEIQNKYPVGTKVRAKVRTITDYGAFVELDEGIDGLIHVSDMSWTKRIGHPSEILKKGQKIEAVVLNVDAENKKLALGLKQTTPDPWLELADKYPAGAAIEGVITKVTNFGIFVEIEKDVEGLVHASELEPDLAKAVETNFKAGDKINARVVKVDTQQRKIALTTKEV